MKKNKKVLSYDSFHPELPSIGKIKDFIPKWYKESNSYLPGVPAFRNKGLKLCIPYLESLTVGYAFVLPCDVVVQKINGKSKFIWPKEIDFGIADRPHSTNPNMPVPNGTYKDHFAWQIKVSVKLPKGYSALVTHPLNRNDLPFITMSGIADYDEGIAGGSLPFFLKDDFEGIIEQGTPIAQIIPFKRDEWESKHLPGLSEETKKETLRSQVVTSGYYKKNRWHRKSFE
jgi:hypothetical protein